MKRPVIQQRRQRGPRWWRETTEDLYALANENRVHAGLGLDYSGSRYGAMLTAWPLGGGPPIALRSFYDFQLYGFIGAGDTHVLVYDGTVIGPNDDPVDPAGMPSNNTYVLDGFNNDDEIWVGVLWDVESDDGVSGDNITSVWIDRGAATPDDAFPTQYITIGHVLIKYSGSQPTGIRTFNEVLGDIEIPYPPYSGGDGTNDLALTVDKDTGNVVWKKVCTTPCP